MSFPLMVSETDLLHLGGTTSANFKNDNGFDEKGTSFIFQGSATNVEIIIMKSIMKTLGYRTSSGEDFIWHEGDDMSKWGTLICTDYPFSKYLKLKDK